ncbi:MAG: ribonuclease E/G, partial [Terracidiphilus sp.]
MAKEICISSTPHETRLAILEDDQLAEIYYERENEYTLAGSIYNGRVTRVLPGMQSAFVDLGLERDAFLYVTDFLEMEDTEDSDELEKAAASGSSQPPREVRAAANGQEQTGQNRTGGRQDGRQEDRGPRSGQRQDGRPGQQDRTGQDRQGQDRQPREQRLSIEAVPESPAAGFAGPEAAISSGEGIDAESGPGGARRWRGRRRRRGGRGATEVQSPQTESEGTAETDVEAAPEGEAVPEIQAAGFTSPVPAPRGIQTSVPFVLPGESLSKYGAAPGVDAPKAAATPGSATVARPASSYKPSTLIDAPLEWDGSGLLPGESISRHRRRETTAEPIKEESSEPYFSDAGPDAMEEEEFVEAMTEIEPGSAGSAAAEEAKTVTEEAPELVLVEAKEVGPAEEKLAEETFEEDFFEETSETAPETVREIAAQAVTETASEIVPETVTETAAETAPEAAPESAPGTSPAEPAAGIADAAEGNHPSVEAMAEEMSGDDPVASAVLRQDETPHRFGADAAESPDEGEGPVAAAEEAKKDASASHHVDPAPPSGFRLFGLGGKKKTEEAAAASVAGVVSRTPEAEPAPAAAKTTSPYAPGSGLVEEEVIEEEELDAPHHHGKTDDHDLDDFEEETLQSRTGDLGELLQEAHLDHRIQLNFDEKNGEDEIEEGFDEEVDEEEPPAETQPAGGEGAGPARRGDRRDRGRRGRGGQGDRGGQGGQRPGDRRGGAARRSAQTSDLPIISDLLKPGQEILVQIAKEPIAKKGARITSHIALPGRFLVFMPTVSHIGVSRKIASDEERQRLKRILVHERGEASGGFIVRTAGEGASEDELRSDLRMLIHVWNEIKQRSESSKSPALIYHDLGLIERILRDQISADFNSIWVDSEDNYERIVRFLNRVSPSLVRRVKLYTKDVPLFEHFGIQDEIAKALRSKVWLKSGGSIVINQTEALVAIDINTGKYVGKSARLEDTIVKTNLDAVPEIVRQIRLRDLGG